MKELEIVLRIYKGFVQKIGRTGIPIDLRSRAVVGTVQDDPFDGWVGQEIKKSLPNSFEVFHSGSLTTPDLIIRDKKSGTIVGLEIKKLIQKSNGSDSRGLTIDYNSCLPCGSTLIKIGSESIVIPCFYLFALLDSTSSNIVTLIVLDGDFLNYDFELHKESKYANLTEYNHGPYGEGSVRHRRMYTYPNPLNSKIGAFHLRQVLIAKKSDLEKINAIDSVTEQIIRVDKYGNSFFYLMIDETSGSKERGLGDLKTLTDIFDTCKTRTPKERTAAIPTIPPMKK